jgi:hypothetical protein
VIVIEPLTKVTLGHRARLVAAAESGHVAAISWDGLGTLLAPDHLTSTPFQLPAEADGLTISASGSLISVVARGWIELLSTATFRTIHRSEDAFEGCCFGSSGVLWSALTWDDDWFVLEIRDPETWQVVARTQVKDPFGDSHYMILPHPDGEHVAIWVAAGQNGQSLFWARRDGSNIIVDRFPGLDRMPPPSFRGSEFLVICDDNELRNYEFPLGPIRGKMQWPFDDMDNQIGDLVSFVDSRRALVSSMGEQLYLVDLHKMAIVDEVCIRGHETTPGYFTPLPTGGFLSVHNGANCASILTWQT